METSRLCKQSSKHTTHHSLSRKTSPLAGFFKIGAAAIILGALPAAASAAAFDSNVSISGSATFNSGTPFAPVAPSNASQTGSMTEISGGVSTSTALNGATVSGADPLTGVLTNIGDGFGFGFNVSGTSTATADSSISPLFGDYQLNLTNNSAIETFIVTLRLTFENTVNATGGNAFAISNLTLNNSTGSNPFFTGLQSDTNGNHQYNMPDSFTDVGTGAGGTLTGNGFYLLAFTLAPGVVVNLGDSNPELSLNGGSFGGAGQFSAAVTTLLTVDSVVGQGTQPANVPEPETLFLFAAGFAALRLTGRRA